MKDFFRYYFGKSSTAAKASTAGGPFHSLYAFSTSFGFQIFSLILEVVIFLILIATSVAFIKGYMAKDAQGRVENKDKVMRNAIILIIALNVAFIVSTVYKIFSW